MRVTQARIINRKRLGHVAWNRGTREQRIRVAYCVCPRVNPINHRLSLRGGPPSTVDFLSSIESMFPMSSFTLCIR